jgi:hypothetical protein
MPWKHRTLVLADLLVNGTVYKIGVDGIVRPDPSPEDKSAFGIVHGLVNLDAPPVESPLPPTATKRKRPTKKRKGGKE